MRVLQRKAAGRTASRVGGSRASEVLQRGFENGNRDPNCRLLKQKPPCAWQGFKMLARTIRKGVSIRGSRAWRGKRDAIEVLAVHNSPACDSCDAYSDPHLAASALLFRTFWPSSMTTAIPDPTQSRSHREPLNAPGSRRPVVDAPRTVW